MREEKKEKLFEDYVLDINGNAINYNTNCNIAVYSSLFLVLSDDNNFIKRILYTSDTPIYHVKNLIVKVQNANKKVNMINSSIPRLCIESFHKDISSLIENTEVGNNFVDAYGSVFGIAEISDNYIKCFVSMTENEAIELKMRKDAYGLMQRINNHKFIGKSKFYTSQNTIE